MKSLKIRRLENLQENIRISVSYGKSSKFSGCVTDNDNKKSLEIRNKKGEHLIIDYKDIISLKIKKDISADNLENDTLPNNSENKPKPNTIQNIHENPKTEIAKTALKELPVITEKIIELKPDNIDFGIMSEKINLDIPEFTEADIKNTYSLIDKEDKIYINRFYNSFMDGIKMHDNNKCIQAAENIADYLLNDIDTEEYINEKVHILCANMFIYTKNYDEAADEFVCISNFYMSALLSYSIKDYHSALEYSVECLENTDWNIDNENNKKQMLFIMINSCVKCDDCTEYIALRKNKPDIFNLSDDNKFLEKSLAYLFNSKNISNYNENISNPEFKLTELFKGKPIIQKADENPSIVPYVKSSNPYPVDINYGYIFKVNPGTFSGEIRLYSGKSYKFLNKDIMSAELNAKLRDSTLLPIEVTFKSNDSKNAVAIRELFTTSTEMFEKGKKYLSLQNYALSIQCYQYVVYSEQSDEFEREKSVIEISHCYLSLANSTGDRTNINNALSNLNRNQKYIKDFSQFYIALIDIYEKLRIPAKAIETIDKLIEVSVKTPEKLHHIHKKAKILFNNEKYEKCLEAYQQWLDIKKQAFDLKYNDIEKYNEMEKSFIIPEMKKCSDIINAEKAKNTVLPEKITEKIPSITEKISEPSEVEKEINTPKEKSTKIKPVSADIPKENFECINPYALNIKPEYTNINIVEENLGNGKALSPKSFISDIRKKFGNNINKEYHFIEFMHSIAIMDVIDADVLKMQFAFNSSKKASKMYNTLYDNILRFVCENGMINKLSSDSFSDDCNFYSVTSAGRELIKKNTVAKYIQSNCKNIQSIKKFNSQTAMSFIRCFGIIKDCIYNYSGNCERFEITEYICGDESIFSIEFSDKKLNISNASKHFIMIMSPILNENFSYDEFKHSVNAMKNKIQKITDKSPNTALIISSELYSNEWKECYSKAFSDIFNAENVFTHISNDNYIDINGNDKTAVDILNSIMPETIKKISKNKFDDNPETEIQSEPVNDIDDETDEPKVTEIISEQTENKSEPIEDTTDEIIEDISENYDDIIIDENYSACMNDWNILKIENKQVMENVCKMIRQHKFAYALTCLKAASNLNNEFTPFYNALSWALDSPAENYYYISGEIFNAFEHQPENNSEFYSYCMLSAVIRAIFYNHSEYDYSINQLYESVCGNELVEKIPEINMLMQIFCEFRNEYQKGIDFYADYRMKDQLSIENRVKEIISEADKLYQKYIDSIERTENYRIKVFRKLLFGQNEKMAEYLNIIKNDERNMFNEIENFLTDKIIRKNASVEAINIDIRRIDDYIDEIWADAGVEMEKNHRHAIATSDFMGSKRTNILTAINKISNLFCEWLNLVKSSGTDDSNGARLKYNKIRSEIIKLSDVILKKTDDLCSSEHKSGIECVNKTISEIHSRLDGSYDSASRKYYFIGFLKNDFVILDENGIPDLSSSFCLLPEFNIMERIFRHFEADEKEFDVRMKEIFSSETRYNDYGSAMLIDEYLKYINSQYDGYDNMKNINEFIIYSEGRTKVAKESFTGDLELAQSYGQIYSPENKKDIMLRMTDVWYNTSIKTYNFGFFAKLIENFKKLVHNDALKHGQRLQNQFIEIKKLENVSQEELDKIEKLIKEQNYTVAEDNMNRIHNGDKITDEAIPLAGIEFLKEFWSEYKLNYDACANSGKTLKMLITKQRAHKDVKGGQVLIDNWLLNGKSSTTSQIAILLGKLGWKNCTVKRDNNHDVESYKITLQKPQNGKKINYQHPISAFGSLAVRDGFRTICIYGNYDCKRLIDKFHEIGSSNNTLVLLDFALTESERRSLARKIKEDMTLSKTFAIIDRVTLMYLASHYSENNISHMLMAVTMPFSYYQPYYPDSSKVMPAEIFMGREAELNKIESPEGVNIIYGGRQLGKSALLEMAKNDIDNNENGDRAVNVDIQKLDIKDAAGKVSDELFISGILDKRYDNWKDLTFALKVRLKDETPENHIPYLLLMLDEADMFIKDCGNHDYEPLALLKDVQSIGTNRFKFVIAGLRDIVKFDREIALGNNSVITHLSSMTIQSFNYKEARELLTLPLSYMGIYFPQQETISLILATTNYFPGLIQLYCSKLLETLRSEDYACYNETECPPYIVTEKHIKKVLTDESFTSKIKEKFEITLRSDECPGDEESGYHYYLIALLISYLYYEENSDTGYTAENINKTAAQFEISKIAELEINKLVTILDELCSLNILRRTSDGHYLFKRDSFLSMMGKKEIIENKIMEYMER